MGLKWHVYIIICFCCISLPSGAQEASTDAAKIMVMEKKWGDAYKQRDLNLLSSLLAEDFVITVENGSTYSKVGYISHTADVSVSVALAELSDLKARILGNTAVITGAYHEKGISKGIRYEYRDRLTDVWVKVGSKWQLFASHFSVPLNP